jgi:RNA polymerase sigma-70 factor, ECF subfamily
MHNAQSEPTQATPPDETLVQLARTGDSPAFAQLVNRHFGTVWAIVHSRVTQRESAEDIGQEVFILALLHLQSLSDPRRFGAWISRIARHRALDAIRQGARSRIVSMVPLDRMLEVQANTESHDVERAMEKGEAAAAVRNAIQALPEAQREIVLLHFSEGLTKKEIADRLDVHPATVGRQLTQALDSMRTPLRQFAGEPRELLAAPGFARTSTLALIAAVGAMSAIECSRLVEASGGISALGPAAAAVKTGSTTTGGWIMAAKISVAAAALAAIAGVVGFTVYKVIADDGSGTSPAPQQVNAAASSQDANALVQEGWKLFTVQQFDRGDAKFTAAIQLNPDIADAWNGLGWCQFNEGLLDKAEASLNKCLALDPQHLAAFNGLGWIYFNRQKLDQAEKYFLKAAPGAEASWWGLTKIYLLQSRWDEAAKYASQIIAAGQISDADMQDAKAMLKAAQDRNLPDDLRREISPDSATVSPAVQQAWMQMNRGNMPAARRLFGQALADSPNDANALNGMGWLNLRTGQTEDAKSNFEAAVKNNPQAWGAVNGLALVDKQQGRLDDAISLWQRMTASLPTVNAGTYGLANAYMSKQQYAQAVPLWQQIVDANPNDPDAKSNLERAKARVAH